MAPDPWPGTPGGAYSPNWGGDIRLYVWASILAGTVLKWGQSASDALDSGYVWGKDPSVRGLATIPDRLWVDLSCHVLTLETFVGGSRADGAIAQSETGTCSITLADPKRQFDPLNPDSVFQYLGQTRLAPGTPIAVFAEYWNGSAIAQYRMFTGTVDTWDEPWKLHPEDRIATVQASDAGKDLVNRDYGAAPAAGAGDTVNQRIARILDYYSWTGTRNLDTSALTLQATTMAQSAWELIGRATEDELGFTFVDGAGVLQFRNRETWQTNPDPVLTIGCSPGVPTARDVMTEASAIAASLNITNTVFASVIGGTQQTASNQTSIDRYGVWSYKRTDLGLQTDAQAAGWASFLVSLQAWPRPQLESVTVLPAFSPGLWPSLLSLKLITDRVRVLWSPPDAGFATEVTGRALGVAHSVTHAHWSVKVQLALADIYANLMHWGSHPKDRLSVGNVYR